jgi:hypothetical protein
MSLSNYVNSAGLILDIIGAGLLWKFGLPAEITRSGATFLTTEGRDQSEVARARHYDQASSWGFGLLVVGFALQLGSNFLAP